MSPPHPHTPDARARAEWDCPGKYQTATCEDGFTCDPQNNFTCVNAGPGEGVPKETCDAGCKKPAKVFGCNRTTFKCEEVEPGHPNDGAMEACTESCQVQYTCDKTSFTCVEAHNGEADSKPKDQCDATCKKPDPMYKCDSHDGVVGNFTCKEATAEEGGIPQSVCLEQCVAPKPTPETPNFLKGLWRGVQINSGYAKGEWDFNFGEKDVTITQPDKTTFKADVFQYMDPGSPEDGIKTQVWLVFSDGAAAGKTMKGKFDEKVTGGDAPETQNVFLGFGKPDVADTATAPESSDAAMAGSGFTAYVLSKCKPGLPNCEFVAPAGLWSELSSDLENKAAVAQPRQLQAVDACNAHGSCKECTADDQCGWCSVPVVYENGQPGAQCAGFAKDGKPDPWTCAAMYKRTDCGDYLCDEGKFQCREAQPGEVGTMLEDECEHMCKPVNNTVYVCDKDSYTCKEAGAGADGAKSGELCEAECVAPPPPPPLAKCNNETKTCEEGCHEGEAGCIPGDVCSEQCSQPNPSPNPTPADPITPVAIRGVWRGIAIQNGYTFGEMDAVITESNATFQFQGEQAWHGNVTTGGGAPMTITPLDGKYDGAIKCLYTQQEGSQTTRMTIAMGKPGADAQPDSYDVAMTADGGLMELYLVKCKGEAPAQGLAAGAGSCDFSHSAPH